MLRNALVALTLTCTPALADAPEIQNVSFSQSGDRWTFDVTILHGDTGWDDYADGWRIIAPDGSTLGTRVLAHPHVNEQPFTRSLSGVKISRDITEIKIQASESVGGYTSEVITIKLR